MSNLAGKKLERPREGRWVAGVCAGLGEYFEVDVNLVRVVFAVVTLIAGVGILVYLAGWILMPEQGESSSIAEKLISSKTGTGS